MSLGRNSLSWNHPPISPISIGINSILESTSYISYICRQKQYPGIHQLYLLYLQVEIVSWNPPTISSISIGRNSILESTNYISYIQVEIVSWNPPTISPISMATRYNPRERITINGKNQIENIYYLSWELLCWIFIFLIAWS